MPWWGWLIGAFGLLILALSTAFTVRKALGRPELPYFAFLISAGSALLAGVLFGLLAPQKPPNYLMALSILFGLAGGAALSFTSRVSASGKMVVSSHSCWYLVAWSSAMLLCSILVMLGSFASKSAVVIAMLACFGTAGYASAVFSRFAWITQNNPSVSTTGEGGRT